VNALYYLTVISGLYFCHHSQHNDMMVDVFALRGDYSFALLAYQRISAIDNSNFVVVSYNFEQRRS